MAQVARPLEADRVRGGAGQGGAGRAGQGGKGRAGKGGPAAFSPVPDLLAYVNVLSTTLFWIKV